MKVRRMNKLRYEWVENMGFLEYRCVKYKANLCGYLTSIVFA